jgi:hypothetical protein
MERTMSHDSVTRFKHQAITYGLLALFILKFGKFLSIEAWDVLGPLVKWLGY